MSYTIIVIEDNKEIWKNNYTNCIEAVHAFDKFVDYGLAVLDRTITLITPDQKLHTKTFIKPGLESKLFLFCK